MLRALPSHAKEGPSSARRSSEAILLSVTALLSLVAKKACQASKKLRLQYRNFNKNSKLGYYYREPPEEPGPIMSPRMTSIRRRPKELFTSMSNKAIKLVHGRKKGAAGGGGDAEDDFGDGGVWQKTILMGDKCQPLDFSGVIYYDESGKKLNNLPVRSPRASPMPGNLS
ncbi:hypothetical protein SAY87_003963 [Trapa incisa]|uniref:Uncharacterized protein n=1 Tax=Trapa incisa TaxID=236973 RepID=A0AAN7PKX8_9MYRT|nr:hypothetical protein SAY87_003963 [Trapa incisa]